MLAGGPTIMLCHFRVPLRAPYEEGTAAVTGNGLTLLTRRDTSVCGTTC